MMEENFFKKIFIMSIIVLFVGTTVIPSIASTTINIDSNVSNKGVLDWPPGDCDIIVPDDYPTIQEAIDAAQPGYCICVRNGTYQESIDVYKMLTIIGENQTNTIITTDQYFTVKITADRVNISGFKISRLNPQIATIGINIGSLCNNISGNNVSSLFLGIWIQKSYNLIQYNIISNNENDGIWLDGVGSECKNNSIIRNIISTNLNGINSEKGISNYFLQNNIVSNNQYGIYIFENSRFNKFKNNSIYKNKYYGILIADKSNSNDNVFWRNKFYENGIYTRGENAKDYCLNRWNLSYGDPYINEDCCGNYWDDHRAQDYFSGPNIPQTEPGSDGICDLPYEIPPKEDSNINKDNYPLYIILHGEKTKPLVDIIRPEEGNIYIINFNLIEGINDWLDTSFGPIKFYKRALAFGPIIISVVAKDIGFGASGMDRVEFWTRRGGLQEVVRDPNEFGVWTWVCNKLGRIEIIVHGYDRAENYDIDTINITQISIPLPFIS